MTFSHAPRHGDNSLPRSSIAVQPFANMSADADQEYFSDGIVEDLITDLSRLSGPFLIARLERRKLHAAQ
jgi:adenylate cyclase